MSASECSAQPAEPPAEHGGGDGSLAGRGGRHGAASIPVRIATPQAYCGRELVHRLLRMRFDPPPEDLAEAIRLRVFDTVAAIALGRGVGGTDPIPRGAPGGEGVIAEVRRLCAWARSTEVDDIECCSCTTPGSVAVSVALALTAMTDAREPNLLAAVATGYEAMVAVGEAIDGPHALYRGIWPSYVAAPIAAAATAARVLDLGLQQTLDALSIAAARAVAGPGKSTREPTSRWYVYGCAAGDGVMAALAAERGLTGDEAVLDAFLGASAGPTLQLDSVLPAVQRVDSKPFCTARQTHAAVEAAVRARHDLGAGNLAAIDVRVPGVYRAMIDRPRVDDRLSSIVSAQFQIAAALAQESLLWDAARQAPHLVSAAKDLFARTTVSADPALDAAYPAIWPAEVQLLAQDGRQAVCTVRAPDGAGTSQPDWDWLVSKYTRLGGLDQGLSAAVEACQRLGCNDSRNARALLDLATNASSV